LVATLSIKRTERDQSAKDQDARRLSTGKVYRPGRSRGMQPEGFAAHQKVFRTVF
jgi:hypothetical protein